MSLMIKKPGLQGASDTQVWYVPVVSGTGYDSDFVAFTVDTAFSGFGNALTVGTLYMLTLTAAGWICQSNAGTAATKGVGSLYLPANVQILIDGAQGSKLHILQDAAGGNASLVKVTA